MKNRPGLITVVKLIFQIDGWITLIIGIILIIYSIAEGSESGQSNISKDTQTALMTFSIFMGICSIIGGIIAIIIGNGIGKGKKWARVLGIIWGVFYFLYIATLLLPGPSTELKIIASHLSGASEDDIALGLVFEAIGNVSAVIHALGGILIIIFLSIQDASDWFSGTKRPENALKSAERICLKCGRVMDLTWKACPCCGWTPGSKTELIDYSGKIEVPALVGKHKYDAIVLLRELNLGYKIHEERFSPFYKKNEIIKQTPKSFCHVKPNTEVLLTISLGKENELSDIAKKKEKLPLKEKVLKQRKKWKILFYIIIGIIVFLSVYYFIHLLLS